MIGSGLEQGPLLSRLTHLVAPPLGDLCAIDIVYEPDVISRVAYAHVDAAKEPLVAEVRAVHGFNADSPHGVPAALRTRRSIVIPRVTGAHLEAEARSSEHLAVLRRISPKSWMVVPMMGRYQVLGRMPPPVTETPRPDVPADPGPPQRGPGRVR